MNLRSRNTLGDKKNKLQGSGTTANSNDPVEPRLSKSRTASREPELVCSGTVEKLYEREEGSIAQELMATSSNPKHVEAMPMMQSTPFGRQRRRPKLPKGHLAQSFAKVSSSLPPSSPLPATSEDQRPRETQGNELHWSDEEETNEADDPFGFLAAERKLKKKKKEQIGVYLGVQLGQEKETSECPAEDENLYDDEGTEAFAPRSRKKERNDDDERTPGPPATPHKRATKRRPINIPSSSGVHTPRTGSMPSTPSPSKLAHFPESYRCPSATLSAVPKLASKPRRKKTRTTASHEYDEVLDPVAHSKQLEELLPRRNGRPNAISRSKRGGRTRASTRRTSQVGDTDTETELPSRRGGKRSKKVRSKPVETGITTKGETVGIDLEDTEGRQERLDYFKKLDGYELHKENVYVI